MTMHIHQRKDESSQNIRLWIPLFFIWILLCPLFLLIVLAAWAARILTPPQSQAQNFPRLVLAAYKVLQELDGLNINVKTKQERILIHFNGGRRP